MDRCSPLRQEFVLLAYHVLHHTPAQSSHRVWCKSANRHLLPFVGRCESKQQMQDNAPSMTLLPTMLLAVAAAGRVTFVRLVHSPLEDDV